jgi:hypothetical protein
MAVLLVNRADRTSAYCRMSDRMIAERFYRVSFAMAQHHKWSITELEELYPPTSGRPTSSF